MNAVMYAMAVRKKTGRENESNNCCNSLSLKKTSQKIRALFSLVQKSRYFRSSEWYDSVSGRQKGRMEPHTKEGKIWEVLLHMSDIIM